MTNETPVMTLKEFSESKRFYGLKEYNDIGLAMDCIFEEYDVYSGVIHYPTGLTIMVLKNGTRELTIGRDIVTEDRMTLSEMESDLFQFAIDNDLIVDADADKMFTVSVPATIQVTIRAKHKDEAFYKLRESAYINLTASLVEANSCPDLVSWEYYDLSEMIDNDDNDIFVTDTVCGMTGNIKRDDIKEETSL